MAGEKGDHLSRPRAERHADADLFAALADAVGDDAVDPDRGQQESEQSETGKQERLEAGLRDRSRHELLHRPDADRGEARLDAGDGGLDRPRQALRGHRGPHQPVGPEERGLLERRVDREASGIVEPGVADVVHDSDDRPPAARLFRVDEAQALSHRRCRRE